MQTVVSQTVPAKKSFLYDPKVRGLFYQALLVIAVSYLFYVAATNAAENLRRAKIASGCGFRDNTAGFDISQALIQNSAAESTYGQAFVVGLLNTLIVSTIGSARPSKNPSKNCMVAKVGTVYVEVLRNIPLLVQLLFWYIAVLGPLPQPCNSIEMGTGFYLNSRGLFMPRPIYASDVWAIGAALLIGLVGTIIYRLWAKRQQEQSGRQYPIGLVTLGLILGLPVATWIVFALAGANPIGFGLPKKGAFNLTGGMQILPEFVALLLGFATYTAARPG